MADNVVLARNTDEAPQNDRFAQTVAFSHYNNISAQLPIDPVSNQIVVGGVAEQTAQCLKNIKAVLTSIDVPFDDIVKVTVFLKNLSAPWSRVPRCRCTRSCRSRPSCRTATAPRRRKWRPVTA